MDKEVEKTLIKQLKLLHERSKEAETTEELCELTTSMTRVYSVFLGFSIN